MPSKVDDAPSRSSQSGDDEANARPRFARMPLGLGDQAVGLRSPWGCVDFVGVRNAHHVRRPAKAAHERMRDSAPECFVGQQANRILEVPGAEELAIPG